MKDKVRRFIEENSLLSTGDRVIVALSGGADSVSLLHVLISLKEEYNLNISAAHFNHGIRGEEADRDESFAKSLCAGLGVDFYADRADVPSVCEMTGESEELCGRRLRYSFFDRLAKSLGGAKIATAHTLSDNAETVLWNLSRGAGLSGLCGIPAKRDNIIRPLLCCSRNEIEAYCGENHLSFVDDSTNFEDNYTRNKLRHRVVPVLCELNPSAQENIARSSLLMREAEEYFDKISVLELNKAKTTYGYSCKKLSSLDKAVLTYAVKRLIRDSGSPVDYTHILLVCDIIKNGGSVELGGGYTATAAQGILRITEKTEVAASDFEQSLADYAKENAIYFKVVGGSIYLPDDNRLEYLQKSKKIHNLLLKNSIPCDIITSDTVIRHRRAGDTFTDKRRGLTKTLKKLLNELKIPREKRDGFLVAAVGSTVLWLEGYGTSAQGSADLSRDGEYILLMGDNYE